MAPPKRNAAEPDERDLSRPRLVKPQRYASACGGMVATAHWEATSAGLAILEQGGNAMDAAVAAAFALGVCEPLASGLGGQTMILYYDATTRKTIALDGSSRAPHRIEPGVFSKKELLHGHIASTVPSTPATLDYARERYGSLKIRELLEPTIRLAEEGYVVSELQAALFKREKKKLQKGSVASLFLKKGNATYRAGEALRQPALANTLRRLAKKGIKDFYRGDIATAIHDDMERNGGLIHKDDLAQIPHPIERKPVSGKMAGWRVITFPPPGAGRTLVETLNIIDRLPASLRNLDSPGGAVAFAAATQLANQDRQDRPFDPHYYPQVAKKRMLSPKYAVRAAEQLMADFDLRGETTHLSVMDRRGNAVALTQSIERVGGSCAASPDLGFLYNNYMSSFEYEDISHPYYLRPNAVPWASVAPTIVFRGRSPWAVLGSPGSERIASAVAQTLIRLQTDDPFDAVEAPRIHCALDGKVSFEGSRIRSDITKALAEAGFTLDERDPYSFYLGCVALVIREKKRFIGVADLRRDGSAAGPE